VVNFPVKNLSCGAMAGITATLFTYPLDLIRTRMLYTSKQQVEYSTWLKTFNTIKTQPGGYWNFYHGVRPALIGMPFYAGISFGTFESLKESAMEKDERFYGFEIKDENGQLHTTVNFALGATSATVSQFIIFPVDTARRRMQNASLIASQNSLKDKMSIWLTLKDLWKRSPNPFFPTLIYRGFCLNILRAVPATATSFTVHEYLRNLFNVPRNS
jgi:solute carrier family 25 protein 16